MRVLDRNGVTPQDGAIPHTTTDRFKRATRSDAAERQAIGRAKAGDHAGLRFLYMRYERDVFRYVRSIVRDEHDAEDVTQNVFAKLMSAIRTYEEREVPFSAWILRIARNAALDWLRQRRAIPYEDVRGPDARYDDVRERSMASLNEALETLSDEQRHVVMLRHMVGLTPGEIALRMGKTEGSIHGLHHRARATLKHALVRLDAAPATRTS